MSAILSKPVAARTVIPSTDIAEFLESYCHTLDDGRVDEWSAFFELDAVYQITTRENVRANRPIGIVLCEGRGMMDDRIKALKLANIFEEHTHRHIVGRPLIKHKAKGASPFDRTLSCTGRCTRD